jgi:CP family cyanate transporter-like MFS transporter
MVRRRSIVVAIVGTGLSLRPAVSSLGAVLEQVRTALHFSETVAGLLTALPVLCFATIGALTPRLARRIGEDRVAWLGLATIAAGLAGRAVAPHTGSFIAGTVVALAGIAVANIVLPVLVKRYFPDRLGLMTGLYSTSAVAGVALPPAVTIPLGDASGYGWRGGLAIWAALAAVTLAPWLVTPRPPESDGIDPGGRTRPRLSRSPTALALTAFFGLQSLAAFTSIGWLPALFVAAGVPPWQAAALMGLTAALALPLNVIIPILGTRNPAFLRAGVVGVAVAAIAGYLGLILAPAAAPLLWTVLLTATQTGFPLAITMINLRARENSTATQLSGFTQSGGYTLAALGPLGFGALRDATGSWTAPVLALILTMLAQLTAGLIASRSRYVEDEARAAQPCAAAR